MKYLCLIYDNEKEWVKFPKDVQDKYMGDYGAIHRGTQEERQIRGANQLQPTQTATTVRSRNGKSRPLMAHTPKRRSSSAVTT